METKKITHYDRILRHLQEKGSITSLQAFRDYGVTRLSAVIYDLRQDGYSISSNKVARKNRYGDKVYFAKYELLKFLGEIKREILFRGKTKNELPSRWVYGSLTDVGHKWFIDDYNVNARIITETIGQYTGLKDKNGTKIFEGDIVKLTRTNMYAPTTSFHNQDLISLHRVFWNDQKHCFYQEHFDIDKKRVTGGGILDFNDERAKQNIIEVVGNIYDNPELLGGE